MRAWAMDHVIAKRNEHMAKNMKTALTKGSFDQGVIIIGDGHVDPNFAYDQKLRPEKKTRDTNTTILSLCPKTQLHFDSKK